ncbi:DNA-binding bromodomain-containing protein [Striga hermonthica]|uniref:DNA-binding bromodomain-containing protein n=1 Tax=Striga hermonthica TaxID=68872 RepID=A0A9N7NH48_STRHE|nr:DNA-binding bromodomain-containing protein [Striga hermonthica]
MTKPDGVAPEATSDGGASPSWGTWEELILAFAVNRHGTASWDSVASELQKRTSDPNLPLTAHDCRSKYLDLKRRFPVAPNHVSDGGGGGDVKSGAEESAAPLLEELRRLRVAELRREVERYDLNIESLELKVKRMEEERERSLQEKSASDLENKDMAKRVVDPEAEPGGSGSGGGVGPAVGEEIDKDQLSVNESNSTDPEAEKPKTGEKAAEPAAEGEGLDKAGQVRHEPVEVKTEPDRKSGEEEEDSFNGSSNSIEKSDRRGKKKPVGLVAESGGREEAAKESSDVQSTASRSRKEEGGGGDKVRRGNTSGDEGEHEDQSRAVKELSAQSQPLIDFLQVLRAHKLGSMFQRRLRSQETSKYQKLILQHVDLETVEKRLRQGRYSGSRAKFFRDLLLLVNNALVFFPNNSPESKAARVIRALVSKEMSKSKSESSSGKQLSLQSLSKKDKSADNNSNSLMLKPRLPGSLTVCRKRSSISSKASDKKGQSSSSPANEKFSKKAPESPDEPKITKKRTRENRLSPATTTSTTKTNGKNSTNNNHNNKNNNNNNNNTTKQQEKGGSSSEHSKKTAAETESKKRGAANFLSRMKQGSSPSNNGDLLDALKNTPLTGEGSGNSGGPTEKKKGIENAKRVEKKEQVTRRSTAETRLVKEKGSPVKNVGRPPKRAAPPARKRGRERSENETPPAKKRTRKL